MTLTEDLLFEVILVETSDRSLVVAEILRSFENPLFVTFGLWPKFRVDSPRTE